MLQGVGFAIGHVSQGQETALQRSHSEVTHMAADHPVEIELKLRLPVAARAELEQHPTFQPPHATAPKERHEVTTYFDTPELALAERGVSLRVRRTREQSRPDGQAAGRRGRRGRPAR